MAINDEEGGGERWGRRRRTVRNLLVNGGEDIGDGGKSNGDSRMKSEIQEEWIMKMKVNNEEGGGERSGRRRRTVRNLLVNGGEDIGDGGKSNGDSRMKSEIQEEWIMKMKGL
ncbi:hypothetical protein CTI12_AA213800 [Artemisia annua]|uniref:Uncharacterized protein n=1 Tax=Artemisia annua TaxID=35608 RepID=A0A2U1NXW0_ARTAN|nr:hypothetical protein CTI12_AA213800 [Artemisia annua]